MYIVKNNLIFEINEKIYFVHNGTFLFKSVIRHLFFSLYRILNQIKLEIQTNTGAPISFFFLIFWILKDFEI